MTIHNFYSEVLNLLPFPFQSWVLDVFYRKTEGNDDNGQEELPEGVLYLNENSNAVCTQLNLCLGRRTGKDFLTMIISLYEFYKFKNSRENYDITIVTTSMASASALMSLLRDRLFHSCILTDKEKGIVVISDKSITFNNVSIRVVTPKTQIRGNKCNILIFNEFASMPYSEELFKSFSPTVSSYDNSKILLISTPRKKGDFFYNQFYSNKPGSISIQAPTWVVNPKYSKESLLDFNMSEDKFNMEFGAEFTESDETEQITLRLRSSLIEKLKKKARKLSYEQDKDVLYTDIIRELIENF
jgi:predicted DNA binding CopG/RHH family protein